MKQPELGWTTPVTLDRVIDGDTVVVTVTKEITLRLADVDAPEIRKPASNEEIKRGHEVRLYLEEMIDSADLVMFIPTTHEGRIQDMFSIGARPVGYLFANGQDVNNSVQKCINFINTLEYKEEE